MSTPTIPVNVHLPADLQVINDVDGPTSYDGHALSDHHGRSAVVGFTPTTPAKAETLTKVRSLGSSVSAPPGPAILEADSSADSPVLADPLLALSADVLDDLERVRIANENRLRQLTRTETDSDGVERGFGLDESHRDVARLAALVKTLADSEHQAVLNLNRQMRAHALGPWVKRTVGVGEKQAARLLAAIGDPYWNDLHGRPRLVSELWTYCGYGDAVRQVRRRGERGNWSAAAKMRTFLIAGSCVKQETSPYRPVYDEGRAKYDGAAHEAECKRCGPAGRPAQVDSTLSAGHQHARALRLVSKAVLRDLWLEAKAIHEGGLRCERRDP